MAGKWKNMIKIISIVSFLQVKILFFFLVPDLVCKYYSNIQK